VQRDVFKELREAYPFDQVFRIAVPSDAMEDGVLMAYLDRVNDSEFEGYTVGTARCGRMEQGKILEGDNLRSVWWIYFVYRLAGWDGVFPDYGAKDFGPLVENRVGDPEPDPGPPLPRFSDVVVPPDERLEGLHVNARLEPGVSALEVVVENSGTQPVPELRAWWVYNYESPQPVEPPAGPFEAMAGGGRCLIPERAFEGTLGVGRATVFSLSDHDMKDAACHVASLSSEKYWLVVKSGEEEIYRFDGTKVGEFVENLTDP
jgi:hypothetical protein